MGNTVSAPYGSVGRLQWIDVVKAIAAWMVVTSHLLRRGPVTDLLAAMSVAIFYVLAGMTLHPHKDLRQFLLRLLQRIVLPYLAAGGLSIAVYRILGDYAAARLGAAAIQTTVLEDIGHLLYGSSVDGWMKWNESLWFLPCYCLMIMMAEGISRLRRYHLLLPLVVYAAGGYVGYEMITDGIMRLPWHLETALFVLPLCGIGQYIGITLAAVRNRPLYALLVGAAMLCQGLQIYPYVEAAAPGGSLSLRAVNLAGAQETYLFLILTSVGTIYLIWYLVRRRRLAPWLPMTGARSLDIVLWNKFPVLLVQVVLPMFLPGLDDLFVGGTDATALAIALLLAIPCMAACLVWTTIYRRVLALLHMDIWNA